jgi:RND family efflux transporter MFP subunit
MMKKILMMIAVITIVIISVRIWSAIQLRYDTKRLAIPVVKTMSVQKIGQKTETIMLPGTIAAWYEASIYARSKGYIKMWYHDIGDRVAKSDLLAEIETPELDAQLHEAQANLKVAEAEHALAKVTAKRWRNLVKTDFVSRQATDEKNDVEQVASAKIIMANAQVAHLQALVNFEKVIAPFDGIVTARNTDIGKLINVGSQPNEMKPLFRIAQTDKLRLYVQIPEQYATRLRPNMEVKLQLEAYPDQFFEAKLYQTAEAIDPNTHTMLAQFFVKNTRQQLLPGNYVKVWLPFSINPDYVILPINVILFQKNGLQVAVVDKQNRVHLKSISIHRDFGDQVEISSGLVSNEQVIVNPADSLRDDDEVIVTT